MSAKRFSTTQLGFFFIVGAWVLAALAGSPVLAASVPASQGKEVSEAAEKPIKLDRKAWAKLLKKSTEIHDQCEKTVRDILSSSPIQKDEKGVVNFTSKEAALQYLATTKKLPSPLGVNPATQNMCEMVLKLYPQEVTRPLDLDWRTEYPYQFGGCETVSAYDLTRALIASARAFQFSETERGEVRRALGNYISAVVAKPTPLIPVLIASELLSYAVDEGLVDGSRNNLKMAVQVQRESAQKAKRSVEERAKNLSVETARTKSDATNEEKRKMLESLVFELRQSNQLRLSLKDIWSKT